MFDGVADDILIIVQAVDLEMIVHVDRSGLDARWGGAEDTVTVIDDLQLSFVREIIVDDTVTVTDDALTEIVLTLNAADAVAVDDNLSLANVFNLSFADDVLVVDAPALSPGGVIVEADVVTVDDAFTVDYAQVLDEFVFATDELLLGFVSTLPLVDSVTVTDDFGKALDKVVDDTVAATDQFIAADPFWSSVVLMLHGDGPNNGNSITFRDSGIYNATIARTNTPTQGAVSPNAKASSVRFGGTDNLIVNGIPTAAAVGTSDFTLELWVYLTSSAGQTLVDWRPNAVNGIYLLISHQDAATGFIFHVNSVTRIQSGAVTLNAWHHVAVCRSAGVTKMFVDGVKVGVDYADANSYLQTVDRPAIGDNGFSLGNSPVVAGGFISDVRLQKGVALYTANFTPPVDALQATPQTVLLLNFANASILDTARKANVRTVADVKTSTALSKFGGAAIFLDGVGDAMFVPSAPDHAFGTGDFTIETWINVTNAANAGGAIIYDGRPSSGTFPVITLYYISNGLVFYANGAANIVSAAGAIQNNVWYHIALCRVAGQTRLFINGVQVGVTFADAINYAASGTWTGIGECPWTNASIAGYIEDFRVTKGVGRYAANFTPPTRALEDGPLGAVTSTHAVSLTETATTSSDNMSASKVYALSPSDSVTVTDNLQTVRNAPTFVNGGVLAAGTTLPISTNGAQVGDLIIVFSCHTAHTLSGTGWTHEDITAGYSGRWSWKILDSTANITVSGNNYSFQYGIWRGASNAARVVAYAANPADGGGPWPAPAASAVGQVMMGWAQSTNDATPPTGFTTRYENYVSVFRQECYDRPGASAGATPLAAGSLNMLYLELRKVVVDFPVAETVPVVDAVALQMGQDLILSDTLGTPSDALTMLPSFVGATSGQHLGGTVSYPPGTAEGHLAILHIAYRGQSAANPYPNLTAAGWTLQRRLQTTQSGSSDQGSSVYTKVLTAGDISSPISTQDANGAGGGWAISVYRNVTVVTPLSPDTTGTPRAAAGNANLTLSGVTTAQGRVWVICATDRDGNDVNLTADQGFVQRAKGIPPGAASYWPVFNLDSTAYVSGQTVTITGFATSYEQMAVMLELRGDAVFDVAPNDSVTVTDNGVLASFSLDLLVVGGGGGGGASTASGAGGGGGGAVNFQSGLSPAIGTYPVVVGAAGLQGGAGNPLVGGDGGQSSALGFTANGGGGGGGSAATAGRAGASGGGGSGAGASGGAGAEAANVGWNGGVGGSAGGGGGGGASTNSAGGRGSPAGASSPGPAGLGQSNSISGTSVGYGWGGGGGSSSTGSGGASGNGGANGGNNGAAGGNAVANRGGGGGGGGQNGAGGQAAAGVVIFSYPTGSATCTGGTITTAGGRTIHTFTANGNFQRTA